VEQSAARLVRYLDHWRIDWSMICQGTDPDPPARFIFMRSLGGGPMARVVFGCRASWRAVRMKPDVIHVHGAEYGWAIGLVLALGRLSSGTRGDRRDRKPRHVFVTCHGSLRAALQARRPRLSRKSAFVIWIACRVVALFESRVLRLATSIACVSARVQEDVHALYKVPLTKTCVIPNAVTNLPVAHREASRRQGLLLWVGRDTLDKDLDAALAVFRRIRAAWPSAELLVVGPDARAPAEGVTFTGAQRENQLGSLYCEASILISTSLYEADPLCVKEAMTHGTPVIVTEAASAAVEDGVNGVICRLGLDTNAGRDEFTQKIIDVMSSDKLRRRLAAGALKSSNDFTIQKEEMAYRMMYSRAVRAGLECVRVLSDGI